MWALDCYWNVVALSPKIVITTDNHPIKTAYYISEGNNTRKNQGWTDMGKTRHNEFCVLISENRKDKHLYGTVWKENFR